MRGFTEEVERDSCRDVAETLAHDSLLRNAHNNCNPWEDTRRIYDLTCY